MTGGKQPVGSRMKAALATSADGRPRLGLQLSVVSLLSFGLNGFESPSETLDHFLEDGNLSFDRDVAGDVVGRSRQAFNQTQHSPSFAFLRSDASTGPAAHSTRATGLRCFQIPPDARRIRKLG